MTAAQELPNPAFSPRRVGSMALRYLYLLRGSWPRILELAYWPTVQMVLWGFITQFLAANSSYIAQAFGILLSGVLLWDVLFRGQLGVTISFLEELWSRNLGHLFVSPLRPLEMVCAMLFMSLVRTLIGFVPASLLAIMFFDYSMYGMGLPLVGFFFTVIITGWAVGLAIAGILLRQGLGAESLAWLVVFAIAPISGIYYPISVLPDALQVLAWCLPSAYAFEGMRAVLVDGVFRADLMWLGLGLNLIYLAAGTAVFMICFRLARQRGQLLQMGE